MFETIEPRATVRCEACGTEIAQSLLTCPGCRKLVHAERLKALADEAERADREGRTTDVLVAWREALGLLPSASRQYQVIADRVSALSRLVESSPVGAASVTTPSAKSTPKPRWAEGVGALGAIGLAIWKFKFITLFVLTKAKFLLLGLTKASTFLTMFLSVGAYWTVFGWKFALGFVLSIYIHEMGHVAALMRYGVKASAPLFVPGLGAFIRLRQSLRDPRLDARVGLAGPFWGLGAALASYGIFLATGWPIWGALAKFGAWVNLFNLLPLWQLDGGRAFESLTRRQRWLACGAIASVWAVTEDPMLVLLVLVGFFRTTATPPANEPDNVILTEYVFLVAALAALSQIPVPMP